MTGNIVKKIGHVYQRHTQQATTMLSCKVRITGARTPSYHLIQHGMSPKQVHILRKTLGLTQQKLADIIGAQRHTVARWELGENEPRVANLKALKELAEKAERRSKS